MVQHEEFRFKVNLGGMIEILSEHLYSSPDVYVRELLQNGVDAIVAREQREPLYKEKQEGVIKICIEEGKSLRFVDNGIGLTKEEIHKFLAIIGQSSKKDLENGKILSEYIGRFGIGLLSYFMVSDQIRICTKSIDSEEGYEWIGNPDGTYNLTTTEKTSVGTEIYLEAKAGKEQYFCREKVEELILHFGLLLPYPVLLEDAEGKRRINQAKLPWEKENASKEEILMFGEIVFGQRFLDYVVLESKEGGVSGVGYILPYAVQPSIKQNHLLYLKNMLLTENGQDLLPEWAFFTKCIINAKDLRPTASREGFYVDKELKQARKEIGECIAEYLKRIASTEKEMYRHFLSIHSLAVKSLAIENDQLYKLFIDDLDFVTTRGVMTGQELRLCKEPILHAGMEEYRQLSQIFVAQGKLLVNSSYVYTEALLYKMTEFYNVTVAPVVENEVDDLLKDVSLLAAEEAVDLLKIAKKVLAPFGCEVEIKQFIPANLPAFYYINEEAKVYNEIQRVKENCDDMFSDMLSNFGNEFEQQAESVFYFNYRNPIVKKMIEADEPEKLKDIITILYVQTLLVGGFTLRNNELGVMNDKILALLENVI